MRILAADDETLAREMLTDAIRQALPDAEIFDFAKRIHKCLQKK